MQIIEAKSFWERTKGLLGRDSLPENTGLLIKPCKQVHTYFMRFTIDVVFLDKDNQIIHLETLKPFKVSKYISKAKAVVEFPEGAIEKYNYQTNQFFS